VTGGGLLGLILLSMGWLFFLGGLAVNYAALRRSLSRKVPAPEQGSSGALQSPSGMGFLPGVVGSLVVFFTIPALHRWWGVEIPWPWLWIALPLVLDPFCLGGLLLLIFARLRRS